MAYRPDLIHLRGPYRDWTRRNRIRKRIFFWIYVALIAVMVLLVYYNLRLVSARSAAYGAHGWEGSWIPKAEAEALIAYHGPLARWRITEAEMMFKRDGRWIVVKRRGE